MKAIFAGTFDPFTAGHRDITERALGVFGNVTVAVARETGKSCADVRERERIAKLAVGDLNGVTVTVFDGLLSDFLTANGDCVSVRGARDCRDFEYERELAAVYKSLCGKETVVFMTAAELCHVSSTTVRELARLGGALKGYVVPQSERDIISAYAKRS